MKINYTKVRQQELLVTAIIENRRRKGSIPDCARYRREFLDLGGVLQDDIASRCKMDKSTVSQILAVTRLPDKLKEIVDTGDMELDAALLLGKNIDDVTTLQEIITL